MKNVVLIILTCSVLFIAACMNKKAENAETKPAAMSRMESYFKNHDTTAIAENAVFTNMATGEQTKGRPAIVGMLHYLYDVAFDAHAEVKHTMITDKNAMLEATFSGKQIGDFAGIPATGKEVNVPLCVSYDLNSDGLIQEARFYLLTDVMMAQLKGK